MWGAMSNPSGRPWKMKPEELEPFLRKLREEGLSFKAIAAQIGYSSDRLKKLCGKWGIYKRGLNHKTGLASESASGREYRRGTVPERNVTPASFGSDTETSPEGGLIQNPP